MIQAAELLKQKDNQSQRLQTRKAPIKRGI
jgi:hypothetical protein